MLLSKLCPEINVLLGYLAFLQKLKKLLLIQRVEFYEMEYYSPNILSCHIINKLFYLFYQSQIVTILNQIIKKHYMKLGSSLQSVQQKQRPFSQSLEFLAEKDASQTMRILIAHYIAKEKLSRDEYELSNFQNNFQKFITFIVEKNTSFILKSHDGKIIGLSLNLDIKDLLTLFETTINFSVYESLGMFSNNLKNWAYKLADCRKGDYLFNILTVFQQHQLGLGRRIDYVLRAMAFCKIIGWKSLLYPTEDPFFFLKLGGQMFELLRNSQKFHTLQKQIQQQNNEQNGLDQNGPKLQQIISGSLTYVLIMRMDKLKFVYLDYDKQRIGHFEPTLFDQSYIEPIQKNLKICILPKL